MNFSRSFRLLAATALLVATLPLEATPTARAEVAERETNRVYSLADGSNVPGAWSALTRNDGGVSMTIHTSGLPAGYAITIWWVVFNQPDKCTHPIGPFRCGEGDLLLFGGDPEIGGTLLYATGHVIGGSGEGHYGAYLARGDTSGVLLGVGPGLTNPHGADIYLIVHSHGPAIPGLVDEQISTFGGGCNNAPPGTGEPGPNTCVDLQISVHQG